MAQQTDEPRVTGVGEALTQSHRGWSVYFCVAADTTALYVGMTSRGSGRLAEHTGRPWWQAVETIYLHHVLTEADARRLESAMIERFRPLFNLAQRPVGEPAKVRDPATSALAEARRERDELRGEVEDLRGRLDEAEAALVTSAFSGGPVRLARAAA